METVKVRIEGPDVSPLIEIMKNRVSSPWVGNPYYNADDKTFIVATESYFFRMNSYLLTVMVVRMAGRDRCEIDIISGGGGDGLAGSTLGAEHSGNKQFIKFFKEVCESNNWRFFEETV
jgi:hypothetical protein